MQKYTIECLGQMINTEPIKVHIRGWINIEGSILYYVYQKCKKETTHPHLKRFLFRTND